ncbi:hypothetical protein [Saccharothrix lopnurensis]|uniref:Uncharacterized protein n=1 Tax=Saccharothrix lopnurensis TaxID=1670621 RepID=A0ABW1P9G6_9PSEU
MLDPNETPTVQVALSRLAGGHCTDHPLVLTGAVLGTLPAPRPHATVLFVLPAERVVGGVVRGAANG